MRRFLASLTLVLALAVALVPRTSLAEEWVRVIYDSNADTITCENSLDDDVVDFFPEYKNLMPGDDRTQPLIVSVRNNTGRVRAYFRLQTRDEDEALLSPLTFALLHDGTQLGSASLTGAFRDWTLIATFDEPGEERFGMFLSVPTSLGNEVAGLQRDVIAWVRFEDESATLPVTPLTPATSDTPDAPDAPTDPNEPTSPDAPSDDNGGTSTIKITEWHSDEPDSSATTADTSTGDSSSGISAVLGRLAQTGDNTPTWMIPVALAGAIAIATGLLLRRRDRS